LFIGHFAAAFILWRLFPQIPLPAILISVSFPDLLWSILVPAGVEKVKINPDSPLQKYIVFEKFPYSHSLVLGTILSAIPGLVLSAIIGNLLVLPLFVAGSASHWFLDSVVHLKDLPVLGFDGDRKVGAGLWKRAPLAFLVEYVLYTAVTVFALSGPSLVYALVIGSVFHAINLPSFLGGSRKNTVKSSNGYAALALIGFGAFTIIGSLVL
jgi:hypothetical protein